MPSKHFLCSLFILSILGSIGAFAPMPRINNNMIVSTNASLQQSKVFCFMGLIEDIGGFFKGLTARATASHILIRVILSICICHWESQTKIISLTILVFFVFLKKYIYIRGEQRLKTNCWISRTKLIIIQSNLQRLLEHIPSVHLDDLEAILVVSFLMNLPKSI